MEHGSIWLGQIVHGQWEISSEAAQAVLASLLEELVSEGAVRALAAPSRARRGQGGADHGLGLLRRQLRDTHAQHRDGVVVTERKGGVTRHRRHGTFPCIEVIRSPGLHVL